MTVTPTPRSLLRRCHAAVGAATLAASALVSGTAAASAVSPAAAQDQNCAVSINVCRARVGGGHLILPSNYGRLSLPEQLFVLADLERVNRGETPITGLSARLDADAMVGALQHEDPPMANGGYAASWFGSSVPMSATKIVLDWVYNDGYGSDNIACTSPKAPGCWAHRNTVLGLGNWSQLAAGAAVADQGRSVTLELGGIDGPLVFSWAHELRYFASPPAVEARVTTVTRGGRLSAGTFLTAVSGDWLEMEPSGALALHAANGAVLWQTRTAGHPGAMLRLQSDGNLVVVSAAGKLLWQSATAGHPQDRLAIEANGTAEVLVGAGTVLWRS